MSPSALILKLISKTPLLRPGFPYGLHLHNWCPKVKSRNGGLLFGNFGILDRRKIGGDYILFAGGSREFCRYAVVEQFSDDEYECEFENHKGFTHPVRAHFLEDILETTGYKLTSFNQLDDYGQEKMWKTQKQVLSRKRKNQLTSLVEDALSNSNFEKYSSRARDSLACWTPDCIGFNLIEAVLCHICRKERPGAVLVFMTGWDDINALRDQLKAHPLLGDPNRVLLLTCHGSMATSEQLADAAKSRFSAKDYSDHMALVRAYEGWKDAEREGSAYEYCWRNFLSAQTLQAIHSLRKQFSFLLKDAGLIDDDASACNQLSHNQSLVRAVICAGLFPGIVSVVDGQLKMLEGYLEFFMQPDLAETYSKLKEELEKLIQKKLQNPSLDLHKAGQHLLLAVQELVSADQCDGRFVYGRESKKPKPPMEDPYSKDGKNPKSLLQTLLMRAGHSPPKYKTKHLKSNEFRALVEFKGMQFVGKVCRNKQLAERDAAVEALGWLTGVCGTYEKEGGPSPEGNNNLALLSNKGKKKRRGRRRS